MGSDIRRPNFGYVENLGKASFIHETLLSEESHLSATELEESVNSGSKYCWY